MSKTTTKVGTINVKMLLFWNVYLLAFWTVSLMEVRRFEKEGNTFTREVESSSERPIGRTNCLSHRTLWQVPNVPSRYFSLITANPLGESIKRAWIRPYKSIADWYISRNLHNKVSEKFFGRSRSTLDYWGHLSLVALHSISFWDLH